MRIPNVQLPHGDRPTFSSDDSEMSIYAAHSWPQRNEIGTGCRVTAGEIRLSA